MKKYFNINFQFNSKELEDTIENTARKGKGYCCFIDGTSLVHSYKNVKFRDILNASLVNACDGSYIAMLASRIYKEKLIEYIGPDFFNKFIYKPVPQIILGNKELVFNKLKAKLESENYDTSLLFYMPLPFSNVEDFDYEKIAEQINKLQPQYIWVSLGAPKQEEFMHTLLPLIHSGVMIGIGAALNYFTGEVKDIPEWAKKAHLIWLYRVFTEPKKQIKRCRNIIWFLPRIYLIEKRSIR